MGCEVATEQLSPQNYNSVNSIAKLYTSQGIERNEGNLENGRIEDIFGKILKDRIKQKIGKEPIDGALNLIFQQLSAVNQAREKLPANQRIFPNLLEKEEFKKLKDGIFSKTLTEHNIKAAFEALEVLHDDIRAEFDTLIILLHNMINCFVNNLSKPGTDGTNPAVGAQILWDKASEAKKKNEDQIKLLMIRSFHLLFSIQKLIMQTGLEGLEYAEKRATAYFIMYIGDLLDQDLGANNNPAKKTEKINAIKKHFEETIFQKFIGDFMTNQAESLVARKAKKLVIDLAAIKDTKSKFGDKSEIIIQERSYQANISNEYREVRKKVCSLLESKIKPQVEKIIEDIGNFIAANNDAESKDASDKVVEGAKDFEKDIDNIRKNSIIIDADKSADADTKKFINNFKAVLKDFETANKLVKNPLSSLSKSEVIAKYKEAKTNYEDSIKKGDALIIESKGNFEESTNLLPEIRELLNRKIAGNAPLVDKDSEGKYNLPNLPSDHPDNLKQTQTNKPLEENIVQVTQHIVMSKAAYFGLLSKYEAYIFGSNNSNEIKAMQETPNYKLHNKALANAAKEVVSTIDLDPDINTDKKIIGGIKTQLEETYGLWFSDCARDAKKSIANYIWGEGTILGHIRNRSVGKAFQQFAANIINTNIKTVFMWILLFFPLLGIVMPETEIPIISTIIRRTAHYFRFNKSEVALSAMALLFFTIEYLKPVWLKSCEQEYAASVKPIMTIITLITAVWLTHISLSLMRRTGSIQRQSYLNLGTFMNATKELKITENASVLTSILEALGCNVSYFFL